MMIFVNAIVSAHGDIGPLAIILSVVGIALVLSACLAFSLTAYLIYTCYLAAAKIKKVRFWLADSLNSTNVSKKSASLALSLQGGASKKTGDEAIQVFASKLVNNYVATVKIVS